MVHTGIFPNTFLQPVNGRKKLNLFMCFCSFLFLKHPWKIFHSILLFFLLFGLNTGKRCIKESYICLSSHLFFKTPYRTLKFQEKSKKMHFPAIWRPKFNNFPFGVYNGAIPWSQASSKETESLEKNGCRQKCLDKYLNTGTQQ